MKNSSGRRGGALAVVLISMMVVAGLAIAAIVLTGVWVAHSVRVEKSAEAGRETVRIETPVGAVRIGARQGDPKRLGIPVYPGAVLCPDCGKTADIELDFGNDHNEFSVVAAQYTTGDPPARVAEFYRNEIPSSTMRTRHRTRFSIEYSDQGQKRLIAIHERSGRTEISLVTIGEKGVN